MRFLYKDTIGQVFEYDSEADRAEYGASDLVPMTEQEIEVHLNPEPTPDQIRQQINAEARAYLASTDWYVIRLQETGESVPDEILAERAEARARVVE